MHNILSKYLQKVGITNIQEATKEEQQIFERYKAILEGSEVTVDKIKEFCQSQIKIIEQRFADNPKTDDDVYLKACLHIYLNILQIIDAPTLERKNLEKHLNSLIIK